MENYRVLPNFWATEDYLLSCGAEEFIKDGLLWVEADGVCLFPPLVVSKAVFLSKVDREIWSDFLGTHLVGESDKLDLEYIYKPSNFFSLSGKNWTVFRKNIRKWPRINPGWTYREIQEDNDTDQVRNLLIKWLDSRDRDEDIHDDEVMFDYIMNGNNRKGLWDTEGVLVGLNVWDFSWLYTHYRYCICLPIPFLSEFLRLLFFQQDATRMKRLVNDGGVLDEVGLERFKDKLNPIEVRTVKSWRPK
jgi:hypothetical protein